MGESGHPRKNPCMQNQIYLKTGCCGARSVGLAAFCENDKVRLPKKTLSGNGHSPRSRRNVPTMPEEKQSIVMTGNEKSQPGKGGMGRLSATRRHPEPERISLIEKTAFLGEIAQQKTDNHGDHPHPTQLLGRYLQNLAEPALHGFGRDDIR
jgi:hypothetical protein